VGYWPPPRRDNNPKGKQAMLAQCLIFLEALWSDSRILLLDTLKNENTFFDDVYYLEGAYPGGSRPIAQWAIGPRPGVITTQKASKLCLQQCLIFLEAL